jgi:hypothetical protein
VISYKIARRSFLRGCGKSAVLLAPLLRSIEARAQGLPAPLRFLVIRHACGSPLADWRPSAAATTTNFTLPAQTAAFAPLKSKMVLVDGLNIVTASQQAGNSGGLSTSEGGTVAVMTGVPTLGQIGQQDHCAGGPSIDQILLDRSSVLGGGASLTGRTPFGSLQLAADIRSTRDEIAPRVLSYRPPTATVDIGLARQPMNPETHPLDVFTRIFAGVAPPGTGSSLLLQKLSILDFMRSDLARLNSLVPASEKVRLQQHADSIQSLEASIRTTLAPPSSTGCVVPPMPPSIAEVTSPSSPTSSIYTRLPGYDYYTPGDPTSHPHQVVGRLHLSLAKAAFLCDLVRVATFSWSSGTSWVAFPGTFDGATLPGNPVSAPHYESLHADPTTPAGTATAAWAAAIDRFYSDQTSQAIQELAAATDVDGNSLLDNTVVVYLSEIARGWDHNQMNVPFLVFGGKNTRLRGGTFLKITDGPLPGQTGLTSSGGTGNRPVNDAWLALAPIFGVNLASLGDPSQYTGPLPGLVG